MNQTTITTSLFVGVIAMAIPSAVHAQVTASATDGFQIKIVKSTQAEPSKAYECLINDLSKWWSADHTYSGKSQNLSMDLEKGCMYEKLPDGGFVRHMEIVFCQPGKTLRLTGGLGPLQEMGVAGAMTFRCVPKGDSTDLELTYNVSGAAAMKLDVIAPAVESVLNQQLENLRKHCDQAGGIK